MLRQPLVSPSTSGNATVKPPPTRQKSLDVLRGFTVLLMVFVDEIGAAFPHINHSPWDNITLADFVMPWFLFMVGTSLSISLRKYKSARAVGTRFVGVRALKLFGLGVLMQGGNAFPVPLDFNLATLRFCGILNRIGFAYLVAALLELWIPERKPTSQRRVIALWPLTLRDDSSRPPWPHLSVFSSQAWRWLGALFFVALHLSLTLFTYVPSWTSRYGFDRNTSQRALLPEHNWYTIECDARGSIATPECSAASFYDRMLFGQDHLGTWMSDRLPQCSSCSPGAPDMYRPSCTWQPNATAAGTQHPNWCFAHMYDPEGALATVPTAASVWVGAHFGRVLRADGLAGSHVAILSHWCVCSLLLITLGLLLHATCLPMNKQLWSTSYLCFMAGTCGAALSACYLVFDVHPRPGDLSDGERCDPNASGGGAAAAGGGGIGGGGGGGGGVDASAGGCADESGCVPACDESLPPNRSYSSSTASSTRLGPRTTWNGSVGSRRAASGGGQGAERVLRALERIVLSRVRWLLFPLEAMGMNAIFFFFWHGTAEAIINAVYFDPPAPGGGLVHPVASTALLGETGWVHEGLLKVFAPHDAATRQLVFVILKLAVYLAVAVECHRRRYFWKL